ncbi:MAG: ABC transporter ATP-binding protein [Acetobacteraceae bacterium]|nr:ABC transporter ATP-binding protein [Acetobacteraceae bacterium]
MQTGEVLLHDAGVCFSLVKPPSVKERLLGRLRGNPRPSSFWGLRHVSFHLPPGQTLGVLGRNGAGKTTLLRLIAGIFRPDEGTVEVGGRVSALLGLGMGFRPELSGLENVFLDGLLLGLSRRQIQEWLAEVVEFSELGEFIHQPVRTYSSGMRARLGFSVAVHVDPDVLLLDEILGVGDPAFRKKSAARLRQVILSRKTVILVSHNLGTLAELCEQALWLERGGVVALGPADDVLREYQARLG